MVEAWSGEKSVYAVVCAALAARVGSRSVRERRPQRHPSALAANLKCMQPAALVSPAGCLVA